MIRDIQELNLPTYATLSNATITLADMGDKVITTQLKIDGEITPDFSYDWEILFRGEKYIHTLREPQGRKDNTSLSAVYDLTFKHYAIHELQSNFFVKINKKNPESPLIDQYVTPFTMNLTDFVEAFNDNLNYYFHGSIIMDLNPAWVDSGTTKTINISYSYHWDILQQFYELWGVRWVIEAGQTPNTYVIKVGYPAVEIDHIFEYGYEGGLLKFERQVQDANIRNIILGRGGEKNLPYRYFKAVDANNPSFAPDPDAIPELQNMFFSNLMPKTFRDYVQGWKVQKYGAKYEPNRGYAYERGYTDVTFNPVEFIRIEESIDKYGEQWGGLDNNEEIFPTIQGISLPEIGRVDEIVYVEPVNTDNIEDSIVNESVLTNIRSFGKTIPVRGKYSTTPISAKSMKILVPYSGATLSNPVFNVTSFAGGENTLSYIILQNKEVKVKRVSDNVEVPISNIPNGIYYLEFSANIYNTYPTDVQSNVTVMLDNIKLIASEHLKWKRTFDIYIKNIWQSSRHSGESDLEYAERIWKPIFGDRLGNEAKVSFTTGWLGIADYEFTITDYAYDNSKLYNGVNSEWKLTLAKSDAEIKANGQWLPNMNVNAKGGDFFFFTGIDVPYKYVFWAEEKVDAWKLDQSKEIAKANPTWVLDVDKIRCNELTELQQGELRKMIDLLTAGVKLRSADKRLVIDAPYVDLYAQTCTITWSEGALGLIPDISLVLTDKVIPVLNPVAQLQGEISGLQQQFIGLSNIEQIVRAVGDKIYLRKDGVSDRSISPTEFAGLVSGTKFRQGGFGGADWGIYRDDNGNAIGEFDRLVVRQDMQVNNLVINQVTAQGGKEVFSAAVMKCNRVDEVADGYICYFDQKQGSVANLFQVDDVAYSQVFNEQNIEIKFYKRKVIAIDVDNIKLSKTIANGIGIPMEGDTICHYGNYTNTERQYVMIRDVIGGGYERYLEGLNSVNSSGIEYYFAGRQTGQGIRWFIGDNKSSLEYKNKQLVLRGTLVQSPSGATSELTVYRGNWLNTELYYVGDEVFYNGSSYRCRLDTPTAGIMPINTTYWAVIAAKGGQGEQGAAGKDAMVISLMPSTNSVRQGNNESFTPTSISARVMLSVGNERELVGDNTPTIIRTDYYNKSALEIGTIISTTGLNAASPTVFRSVDFVTFDKNTLNVVFPIGGIIYEIRIHYYDSSKQLLGNTAWLESNTILTPLSGTGFIRWVARRKDGAPITPSDMEAKFELYTTEDVIYKIDYPGRNYLVNSKPFNESLWAKNDANSSIDTLTFGESVFKLGTDGWSGFYQVNVVPPGEWVVEYEVWTDARTYLRIGPETSSTYAYTTLLNQWEKIIMTYSLAHTLSFAMFRVLAVDQSVNTYVRNIKLFKAEDGTPTTIRTDYYDKSELEIGVISRVTGLNGPSDIHFRPVDYVAFDKTTLNVVVPTGDPKCMIEILYYDLSKIFLGTNGIETNGTYVESNTTLTPISGTKFIRWIVRRKDGAPITASDMQTKFELYTTTDTIILDHEWSPAPEDYIIKRNGQAYTAGSTIPSNTLTSDTTWTLFDPFGKQIGGDTVTQLLTDITRAILFQGDFATNQIYYNNIKRQDVVKYNNAYYRYIGPNATAQTSWISSRWNPFGSSFDSVATNLLFAENALLADWVIRGNAITSQKMFNSTIPMAKFNGELGYLEFYGNINKDGQCSSQRLFVGSTTDPISGSCYPYTSSIIVENLISPSAVRTEVGFGEILCKGVKGSSTVSGISTTYSNTSYAGFFSCNGNGTTVGAVIGDVLNSTASQKRYGGIFKNLYAKGLILNTRQISSGSATLISTDTYIIAINTTALSLNMMGNPEDGRTFYFRQLGSGMTTLFGNGYNFLSKNGDQSSSLTVSTNTYFAITFQQNVSLWILS